MINFKQYLYEALRTRPESNKLLNAMYNRMQDKESLVSPNQMKNPLPRSNYNVNDLSYRGQRISQKHLNDAHIEYIPTHKIKTEQDLVDKAVISKKIQGKFGPHNPDYPWIVRFQHKGETHHLLLDGNHQVSKNVIRGIPMTKSRVLDVDHNSKFLMDY